MVHDVDDYSDLFAEKMDEVVDGLSGGGVVAGLGTGGIFGQIACFAALFRIKLFEGRAGVTDHEKCTTKLHEKCTTGIKVN